MTLSNVNQRPKEILKSYLTRFNEAAVAIFRSDPSIILMVAVSEVASKIDFKIALEMNPSMDLVEF